MILNAIFFVSFLKKDKEVCHYTTQPACYFFFGRVGEEVGVAAVVLFHFTHQVTSGYSFSFIISIRQQKSWEKAF